jgi:preprotein translocase subunit SecB
MVVNVNVNAPQKHPIQLQYLGVKELFIKANVPPDFSVGLEETNCCYTIASPKVYDPSLEVFAVSVTMEVGMDDKDETPFSMKIELTGFFTVDTVRMSTENVVDWASKGAMFIFLPFLREHAYALSSRCGFKPLLLPLLEVPTFKIQEREVEKTRPKTRSQIQSKASPKRRQK